MKKIVAFMMTLLIAFTLSSCSNDEPESYKLENFLVSSVKIFVNEKIQYDSLYNADSTNEILFTSTKDILADFTLTKLEDAVVCETNDTSKIIFEIELTTGDVSVSKECYVINGDNTVSTIITFEDNTVVYTDEKLFDDIDELLK